MLVSGMEREQPVITGELANLSEQFGRQFFQRRDLYARQLDDGRYICVHKPLPPQHLVRHLKGEITLGTYLLDENSQARFIVLDADDETGFKRLLHMAQMLAVDKTPAYIETSRRGGHAWLFFGEALPGKLAREFGKGIMKTHKVKDVELFPKQDQLGEGPGSLMRAPFGLHRLTRQRYSFIDLEGKSLAEGMADQICLLTNPRTVRDETVKAYAAMVKETAPKSRTETAPTLSKRIKEGLPAMEFIGRYVELEPGGNGAAGHCPFHDDQHASFAVNAAGNYWSCFAGCGGGSVIDFWMKWRKCDFKTALAELARML